MNQVMSFKSTQFLQSASGAFTEEASTLGLPAGASLPTSFNFIMTDHTVRVHLTREIRAYEEDVQGWEYKSANGTVVVRIWND